MRPPVTIVMAVYKPRIEWFVELLSSLNKQTYSNLDLIICNDAPDYPISDSLISKYISKFPYMMLSNEKNLGSNKTFERLTLNARGEYIAYCDQDDIWEDDKIELLVKRIVETGAVLCCSDLSIINENGKQIADSITKIRKHHVFLEGENLAAGLIIRNFVTGCTMLMRTDIAKTAVPFENDMVHDHWLALFAALHGRISFEPERTVRYRQHQNNQTGVLTGVSTKEDYLRLRIELLSARVISLKNRLRGYEEMSQPLETVTNWVLARKNYFLNPSIKNLKDLWLYRDCGISATVFEIFTPLIPDALYGKVVSLLR